MNEVLLEAAYAMGVWHGAAESLMEDFHTCEQKHLRTPWPLDPKCQGCQRILEKHVKRNHLELAYRLFGWDAMIDSYVLSVNIKIAQRDANLKAREAAKGSI